MDRILHSDVQIRSHLKAKKTQLGVWEYGMAGDDDVNSNWGLDGFVRDGVYI